VNASRFAIGLVGLAIAGLWYFAGGAQSLPVSQAAETPRVTQALRHENLTVYFVYGTDTVSDAKVMTLSEALERELAVVHETSDVNTLAVENKSPDCELFIQSGDIVKGGKQDRMAATDMLLPPKSGVVAMKAHCVEQGRWTGRGSEDSKKFKSSVKCAVGNEMKIANYSGQQSAVWQTVATGQTKLKDNLKANVTENASPTSFQLTLEAPAVKEKVTAYESSLKAAGEDRGDIIGVVFVVNGQITSAEVYGSNAIFRKAWPKLLNAAAVEAVAERDKVAAEPPSAREIEYFLARAGEPEPAAPTGNISANPVRGQMTLGNFAAVNLINDNEEVFQTEGRAPGEFFQTEGRQPLQTEGRQPLFDAAAQPNRHANVANDNIGQPNTPALPTGGVAGVAIGPFMHPPRLNGQQGVFAGNYGNPLQTVRQPAQSAVGNRLNSNFNDNRSSLMVESRDPARQNAVIHRSYLKK
jgi:hypothetical protein